MSICACGCGEPTAGGTFRPGHDAKLRAKIEEKVGGLLPLDRLVELARKFAHDQLPLSEFGAAVKKEFGRA
jgi:hypothetical protein